MEGDIWVVLRTGPITQEALKQHYLTRKIIPSSDTAIRSPLAINDNPTWNILMWSAQGWAKSFTNSRHSELTQCLVGRLSSSFQRWGHRPSWPVAEVGFSPCSPEHPGEGKGYPLQYSGLENSMDYSSRGHKESDMTERLALSPDPTGRAPKLCFLKCGIRDLPRT